MNRRQSIAIAFVAAWCTFAVSIVSAQAPTTVQLPVIQVFSVNTTVSVPDGGAALLGGINRAADSSVTRGIGPLRNRGLSSVRSSANMSVHATIIDHQEMDEAILAQAAARRSTSGRDAAQVATNLKAEFISRNLARGETPRTTLASKNEPSLDEIRRRNELAAADREAEANVYFAKAQSAEKEGKPNVSKIYYQMVSRRATGSLKQQADQRLAALQSPGKVAVSHQP
jgi:hypothetical protein